MKERRGKNHFPRSTVSSGGFPGHSGEFFLDFPSGLNPRLKKRLSVIVCPRFVLHRRDTINDRTMNDSSFVGQTSIN